MEFRIAKAPADHTGWQGEFRASAETEKGKEWILKIMIMIVIFPVLGFLLPLSTLKSHLKMVENAKIMSIKIFSVTLCAQ